MRILIEIGHPARVHVFKNVIRNLKDLGHEIKIAAMDKENTLNLLKAYEFDYEYLGKNYSGLLGKVFSMINVEWKLLKIARMFKPDLFVGSGSLSLAHVSSLIHKPCIAFCDTDFAKLTARIVYPFIDVICTPSCFKGNINPKKHIKFDGYKEIAYLHPNYFRPNPSVLEDLGLSENDKFIILRFISWGASHDVGLRGIKIGTEINFVKSLEKYGEVFITSERKLDVRLKKYRLRIPPEEIHSLLYYADLYIGEGGTMATEAAILGTPSIHIESTSKGSATGELSGNFLELRDKYGLLYFYPDQNQALKKAISILEDKNSKNEWRKRRERLLSDKIDVTAWMVDFIERYPESFYEYKEKI